MNTAVQSNIRARLIALFLLFLSFCLHRANGQGLSPFKAEYAYYPNSNLNEFDTAETQIHEFELSVLVPLRMQKKLAFLAGATYRHAFPETSLDLVKSNLFFLGFNAFGIYKFSDSAMLVVNVLPAISTSGNSRNINSDNVLWQGGVFFRKIRNDRFSYLLGVLSTSRFGRPIVLPAVGLTYETQSLKLNFNFPIEAEALHKLNERFSYGLHLSLNGSQYNFNDIMVNNTNVDLARFSRVALGPVINYRIKGPLHFSISAGLTARRNYTFELENNQSIDLSLSNGPFVATRLYLKPQQN